MADIQVLKKNSRGALVPGLTRPPRYIEGIDLLVQNVALLYLNNGGRSIFQPGRAGGLRGLIGSNYDPDDPSELFADLRLMTSQIEKIIKEEQVALRRPPSERLDELQLIDISTGADETEVEVVVMVINEERQTAQAVVVTP